MNKSRHTINDTAWVDFYQQENPRPTQYSLPSIIICPGGGYEHISKRESEPLAFAFLAQGYQVFVLNYTVMNKGTTHNFLSETLLELHHVFELIHENYEAWNINLEQIFLLGCSAGGHLASWYSNQYQFYKPKGIILCYPVTSFTFGWPNNMTHFNFTLPSSAEYNTAEMVTSSTPPTFIWHTGNDCSVPIYNSLKYCDRLAKYHIPFEAHFFDDGPHGLSLANRVTAPDDNYIKPSVQRWLLWAIQWLEKQIQLTNES
ncbi:alpha/beta hydrolase [Lactococcus allomyrinae]|uniref:Alpha/beta hydrolase n=1 Tax=Lactococcus allomyrinae TaxID=2419773 RepID=A0A387BI09_9LACT|nr:alpha/beta hydrolase [Lactococcus allomyrinae]AYG01842.1 alpha/beta hydrolase [Lactococcus allomyrinae]